MSPPLPPHLLRLPPSAGAHRRDDRKANAMKTSIRRFFRPQWVAGLALCAPLLAAQAACPSWSTAERFIFNGAEVTDTRTGLVWARCSVGQSWSGSACTGTASTFTHEGALAHAQSTSGWRLPNVKELAGLADKGCGAPAIDQVAFPDTPSSLYWSSSPSIGNSNNVWNVGFYDGTVYNYVANYRHGNYLAVRLVRAGSTCSSTATSTPSAGISTTSGESGTPITSAGSTGGVASGSGDSGTTSTGTGFTPSCF